MNIEKNDRGSGTGLVAAALVVGCLMAGLAGLAGSYLTSVQQVRAAADLTALAAAQAQADGGDACAQAAKTAADNDVKLDECHLTGDWIDFVADVSVSRKFQMAVLSADIKSEAYAGLLSR
ncbi:MAG: hypothetical protein LBR32_09095 [Propionibacteriaceae bacterium]|nr:hypothetical protein [Propionibacteriaceae bacterium]